MGEINAKDRANTKVYVLQERHVQSSANGVLSSLREHYMASIIALVKGLQNVVGIILPITVAVYIAVLYSWRRRRHWFPGVFWSNWVIRSTGWLTRNDFRKIRFIFLKSGP